MYPVGRDAPTRYITSVRDVPGDYPHVQRRGAGRARSLRVRGAVCGAMGRAAAGRAHLLRCRAMTARPPATSTHERRPTATYAGHGYPDDTTHTLEER